MIKEIKYNGYSANPSDYECADGDLATSLNLISEDNQLKPVFKPSLKLHCAIGERVLFIHRLPNGNVNYIIASGDLNGQFSLFSFTYPSVIENVPDTSTKVFIGTFTNYHDISCIGNTLILALESGIFYILWKDGVYSPLGNKPPFISIDFGQLHELITVSDVFNLPGRFASTYSGGRGTFGKAPETDDLAELTQSLFSLINQKIADEVTKKGFFHVPFFVRYAYRLYDGSYRWHSAPILLLNNICPPIVRYTDDGSNPGVEGRINATLYYELHRFALTYRILYDGAEQLKNWSDIVSGIDIFVSAPIYTYDQSKDIENPAKTTRSSMLLSLYDWYAFATPNPDGGRLRTPPSSVYVGHYANTINGDYVDRTESTTDNDNVIINIRQHPNFHKNIRDVASFYKIAEIKLEDIKWMQQMQSLPLLNSDLSALVTFQSLPDDYQSHHLISAKALSSYNARLHLAGISIAPPVPFPLRSCTQFSNPSDYPQAQNFTIKVYSRINGVRTLAICDTSLYSEAGIFFSPQNNFPRYIYYPDASAYKMELYINSSLNFIIPLTPHNFLNGAYYYSANFNPDPSPTNIAPEADDAALSVALANKVYYSEVNNPFNFGFGIVSCGNGQVYALSSAAKALSQGQFGQFPLYAFTSEGVWALEVSSTGTYSAKQPITRDVVINPDSITQIDSAVLFATDRGIMHISGSTAKCISDLLNTEEMFSIADLPKCDKLITIFNGKADESEQITLDDISLLPFNEFLQGCRMVYDYTNQHLIVYNPTVRYAYVYSLKSQMWGMMRSDIVDNVNSYPEALAMADGAKLVDFSNPVADNITALIITRPFKIDDPNTFKTINTIIQRGMFRSTHVQQVLYGSNDLIHWHTVWSSVDKIMRGFRGTPYKAFRLALVCKFDRGESIYGCTVVYEPRMINQVR